MKSMLKKLLCVLLVAGSVNTGFAQKAKPVFAPETPIVYLGIDFTETRVVNDAAATATDIKSRFFPGINQVVVNEVKKYDWEKALDKSNLSNDLSLVNAMNETIDESKIRSTNTADEKRLTEPDVKKVVSKYSFKGKEGVGLMMVMESLSKTAVEGSMYVTFIEMPSGKVIMTERMTGKAQGFGFRNYYAYTVYKVIQEIKKNKISEWRTKYASRK